MKHEGQAGPDEAWLEQMNKAFSDNDVPHRKRPWEAWREWSMQTGVSIGMGDPCVKRIFKWFEAHSPEGSQQIGSLYVGTFFFDAAFWAVKIPVIFGMVKVNATDSLSKMPDTIKARLLKGTDAREGYIATFADCVDYGLGIGELIKDGDTSFYQRLIHAGDQQLQSSVSLLLERNPNPKAMESTRMATEMFMKAYLAREAGLTEATAKRPLGHNLESALDQILQFENGSELAALRADLLLFPPVEDRYQGGDKAAADLWRGYRTAQSVATTVVRKFSGRDCRGSIETR